MPEFEDFGSSDELFRHIRERADDIDSVSIPIAPEVLIRSAKGPLRRIPEAGLVINYCNDRPEVIHREDAERLINEGILQGLRIPIHLRAGGESLRD